MTLELLLVLPIIVMLSVAAVQFGLLFANLEQLTLSSRAGAKAASEHDSLSMINGDPVPAVVLEAIDDQLAASGMTRCYVRLEHNVGGPAVVLESPAMPGCDCGPDMTLAMPPAGEYVRLTVCAELTELMPNALSTFGFSIAGADNTAECTTILRHELTP